MREESKLNLVLASKSPRRKELLGWLDIPFEIMGADIQENSLLGASRDYALDLATQKGEWVWEKLRSRRELGNYRPIVIASDTIVILGKRVFEKPRDQNQARSMLIDLSGQEHRVVTSVFMQMEKKRRVFSVETKVKFSKITDDILEPYLKSGDSMDKAGAYGIQGKGLLFVDKIEGSYSNVVGFPLSDFIREFKEILREVLEKSSLDPCDWRSLFRGVSKGE